MSNISPVNVIGDVEGSTCGTSIMRVKRLAGGGNRTLAVDNDGNVITLGMITQTDWFIASSSGSDLNPGTQVSPLKTYARFLQITNVLAYVTNPPVAALNVHFLEDQPDESDPVSCVQILHDVSFTMDGVLIQVGSGTFGVVTNVSRTAGTFTTAFNADGGQVANYWTQFIGMLVHDVTNDTWFRVDADLGNRQARFTRPYVGVPNLKGFISQVGFNALGMITLGDAYVVYRFPKVHVGVIRPTYFTAAFANVFGKIEHLHLMAATGENGAVIDSHLCTANWFLSECLIEGECVLRGFALTGTAYNCYFKNGLLNDGYNVIGGSVASFSEWMGGAFGDGDLILHGQVQAVSAAVFGAVASDGTILVGTEALDFTGVSQISITAGFSFYGVGALWGSCTLTIASCGRVFYDGTAVGQLLCSGAIKIAGFTTGAKIVPGAPRVINDGVAITAANIDDVAAGKAAGILSSGSAGAGIFPLLS